MKKAVLYAGVIVLLVWVAFSISHYIYVPRQLDSPCFTENVEVPPRAKKYILIQPFPHISRTTKITAFYIYADIFVVSPPGADIHYYVTDAYGRVVYDGGERNHGAIYPNCIKLYSPDWIYYLYLENDAWLTTKVVQVRIETWTEGLVPLQPYNPFRFPISLILLGGLIMTAIALTFNVTTSQPEQKRREGSLSKALDMYARLTESMCLENASSPSTVNWKNRIVNFLTMHIQ
ncbi:hypothetical protein J7K27_04100 [Candidatus Bathyarchaeota archaeon]|nr:hypothetical protein [Candidatus Bathyarchaeota archaeon]